MASQKNPLDTDPISPKPSARKTNTALLNQLKRKVELAERDSSPSSRKRKQKESNDTRNCEQYIESNDERGEDILPRMRNPLTTTAAKFVTDPQGRRRFLGPSSTWAYGRQVMNVDGLYRDIVLAIEICCGLALYLQSIDHRNSAYTYLGLGLRIALSQGLHRDLGVENRDHKEAVQDRSAWWTLYILDRKFSSLMGAPNSLHDEDISAPFPQPNRSIQKSTTLEMHLKLSRLIAKILNSEELNGSVELDLNSSTLLSRVSATINLCYHQCIVLATRPLLMCLLRDKLETRSRGDKTHHGIVGPVKALLKASCDSATKSLRILSALYSQDLLDVFPFDLDHAFSASFVLSLVSAIQPIPNTIGHSYLETTTTLLNALTASGNVSARFRQEELQRLHDILLLVGQEYPNHANAPEAQDTSGIVNVSLMPQGVSPNQMLSVASLLETYPLFDVSPDTANNRWL
ncbi:hypothetical protein V2G26_012655 [Clonostachys chloroleuca]